jgi:hypothetical protein
VGSSHRLQAQWMGKRSLRLQLGAARGQPPTPRSPMHVRQLDQVCLLRKSSWLQAGKELCMGAGVSIGTRLHEEHAAMHADSPRKREERLRAVTSYDVNNNNHRERRSGFAVTKLTGGGAAGSTCVWFVQTWITSERACVAIQSKAKCTKQDSVSLWAGR